MPPAVQAAAAQPRGAPVALTGTPKQNKWAESIRGRMILEARRTGRDDLVNLLGWVRDSSWFIAHADRPGLDDLKWPREQQLAAPDLERILEARSR